MKEPTRYRMSDGRPSNLDTDIKIPMPRLYPDKIVDDVVPINKQEQNNENTKKGA